MKHRTVKTSWKESYSLCLNIFPLNVVIAHGTRYSLKTLTIGLGLEVAPEWQQQQQDTPELCQKGFELEQGAEDSL